MRDKKCGVFLRFFCDIVIVVLLDFIGIPPCLILIETTIIKNFQKTDRTLIQMFVFFDVYTSIPF